MEERLQKVEAGIKEAKEMQEFCQKKIKEREEELLRVAGEREEGVWRVWSVSHC